MRRARDLALVLTLLVAPLDPTPAQQRDSVRPTNLLAVPVAQADSAPPKRVLGAVAQTLGINVVVNRFDAWVLGAWWARPGLKTWSHNLKYGWEWDENTFQTNMFAHPYHGGLYFNTGRANGLDFWESIPLSFLGSWTWEYFGEIHRPSLNDFFMTSVGGIALGELFHRLATGIRDNTARGSPRVWREIAALPLDPIGGLNRLARGEWRRVMPNPPEHDPVTRMVRVHGGARLTDAGLVQSGAVFPSVAVDLRSGDPFHREYRDPWEVFWVRAVLSSGGGLNVLRASGRLYAKEINRAAARHRHVFLVNQRYDYTSNPAQRVGGQSVELGIWSRWRLGDDYTLRSQLFSDLVILGALDALGTGIGERTYDFGPGFGGRWEVALERRGVTYVVLSGQGEYFHTVSGASADHTVGLLGAEVSIPLGRHLGVAFHATRFLRRSRYSDRAAEERSFPEFRFLLTWTGVLQRARP